MRAVLTVIALAAIVPAAAPAATRTFTVTSFDRVRVEGPFEVVIRTGSGSSARAEGPEQRMLERVRMEVLGRTLVIRRDAGASSGGTLRGIRILATTPALTGGSVIGSGSLAVDTARGARFDLAVSGSGGVEIGALDVAALAVTASGAGRAKLAGKARQVRATIQGTGSIDGAALVADDVVLTSAGAGTATLAARRTAHVDATGSGAITIVGAPACTVRSEGAVEVECRGPARR